MEYLGIFVVGVISGWWLCFKAIQYQLTREDYYNKFIERGNKRFKK